MWVFLSWLVSMSITQRHVPVRLSAAPKKIHPPSFVASGKARTQRPELFARLAPCPLPLPPLLT
jgi:transcriptional regulator with AAA-type ATPase domain